MELRGPLELDETDGTLLRNDISFKVIQGQGQEHGLPKFEIRSNLRSISAQDMDHQWELKSDSETRDRYKIFLRPDFRYRSREFKVYEKSRHNQTQWSHKVIFDLDRA